MWVDCNINNIDIRKNMSVYFLFFFVFYFENGQSILLVVSFFYEEYISRKGKMPKHPMNYKVVVMTPLNFYFGSFAQ